MPIFGARDQFGRSRFGQANYGELSLYELVPDIHRVLDEDNGSPLRLMLEAFQEEVENLRREIDLLPFQRDPYLATGSDYPADLLIVAAQNEPDGVLLTLDLDHDIIGTDKVDIIGGSGYELNGRYQVIRVVDSLTILIDAGPLNDINSCVGAHINRAHASSCLVEVTEIEVYEETWGDVKKAMTRLTLTTQSQVEDIGKGYVGILKAFQPVPPPENAFIAPDQALYRVLYIRRRDQALGSPVELICEGGLRLEDLEGDIPERIVFRFQRPSSLSLLANDFGLVTDDNLPDVFQRTEIANVYQFLRLKSSRPAYEARSRGGGFRVSVTHLYKICGDALDLVPESNIFVGETGGGNTAYYSDISVVRPRYDELSADLVLPSGIPVTDVTFFSGAEFTTFNQEIDAYFRCMFRLEVIKIDLIDDPAEYQDIYNRERPFYLVKIVPENPDNGWQVATVNTGAFSLVDGSDFEYIIDSVVGSPEGRLDPNGMDSDVIIDAENIYFNEGDFLCLAYTPTDLEIDCCFCPSAEIMIEIEALPAFINQSGYSGSALAEAYRRILDRLRREQVPIHVHTAIETLVINIEVVADLPEVDLIVSVDVEAIVVDFLEGQTFDTRFDDVPADEETLDTGAEVLTYPGVTLEVGPPEAPPADGETVNILVDPLPDPEFSINVESAIVRTITIESSAHFDDIPADDIETDSDLVSLVPKVSVTVQ